MSNHYKDCEEENGQIWNTEFVLRPHLWLHQLHLPTEPQNFHARFMQPGCHPLHLRVFFAPLPVCFVRNYGELT